MIQYFFTPPYPSIAIQFITCSIYVVLYVCKCIRRQLPQKEKNSFLFAQSQTSINVALGTHGSVPLRVGLGAHLHSAPWGSLSPQAPHCNKKYEYDSRKNAGSATRTHIHFRIRPCPSQDHVSLIRCTPPSGVRCVRLSFIYNLASRPGVPSAPVPC